MGETRRASRGWASREAYTWLRNNASAGGVTYEQLAQNMYGDAGADALRAAYQVIYRLRLRGVKILAIGEGRGCPVTLILQE